MTTKLLALATAVGLMTAACGGDTADTTSTAPPLSSSAPTDLAGTRWVATDIFLGAVPVPIVPNAEPTLDFDTDGRSFGGTTGCNLFGGTYSTADGSVSFGAMSMTEMACEEPRMQQEQTVLNILQEVTFFTMDGGTLTIGRVDGSSMKFIERSVAFPDVELTGTQWIADTIIRGAAASTTVQGAAITLFIDAAGSEATGSTGCNDYRASVEASRTALTFGSLQVTERGCVEPGVMGQEAFVLAIFQGELSVEIQGDRLTLLDRHGDGLAFTAQP